MGEIVRLTPSSIDASELHAYVDGRLAPASAERVALHLVLNQADARRAKAYAEQNLALRRLYAMQERPLPPRIAELGWRLGRQLVRRERHVRLRRLAFRSAAAALIAAAAWVYLQAQFYI